MDAWRSLGVPASPLSTTLRSHPGTLVPLGGGLTRPAAIRRSSSPVLDALNGRSPYSAW